MLEFDFNNPYFENGKDLYHSLHFTYIKHTASD